MAITLLSRQSRRKYEALQSEEVTKQNVKASQHSADFEATAEKLMGSRHVRSTIDELEVNFWSQILTQTVALGATTWATMPITLSLSWNHYTVCLWSFLAAKLYVISIAQLVIRNMIAKHLQETKRGPFIDTAAKSITSNISGTSYWEASGQVLTGLGYLGVHILDLLEVVEPDADAMTPATVEQAFTAEDDISFSDTWKPLLLSPLWVRYLRLSVVLVILMMVITLWQIYLYMNKVNELRKHLRNRDRKQFLCYLGATSDIAGLFVLAPYSRRLWLAIEDGDGDGGIRANAYRARVPEMVFQGWFQVYALAAMMDRGPASRLQIWFAVAVSFVLSFRFFCHMLARISPWIRYWHGQPGFQWALVHTVACMTFHAVGIACTTARLFGVLLCDSHELELAALSCKREISAE